MNRRILLAEDDKAMRSLLAAVLRAEGHDVSEAPNGRELFWFVEIAAHGHPIDLVVTDLAMPTYNGLDVAEAWADSGSGPRVILMTAFPDVAVRSRVEKLGLDLLEKPFDLSRLRQLVHEVTSDRAVATHADSWSSGERTSDGSGPPRRRAQGAAGSTHSGARPRGGNRPRGSSAHLRSILRDQACRMRHGTRSVGHLRDRARPWRLDRRAHRARRGDGVHSLSSSALSWDLMAAELPASTSNDRAIPSCAFRAASAPVQTCVREDGRAFANSATVLVWRAVCISPMPWTASSPLATSCCTRTSSRASSGCAVCSAAFGACSRRASG